MREFEFLVGYERECDENRDFHAVVRIVAESEIQAEGMLGNCTIDEILDNLEDDYIEDTFHPLKCLGSSEVK